MRARRSVKYELVHIRRHSVVDEERTFSNDCLARKRRRRKKRREWCRSDWETCTKWDEEEENENRIRRKYSTCTNTRQQETNVKWWISCVFLLVMLHNEHCSRPIAQMIIYRYERICIYTHPGISIFSSWFVPDWCWLDTREHINADSSRKIQETRKVWNRMDVYACICRVRIVNKTEKREREEKEREERKKETKIFVFVPLMFMHDVGWRRKVVLRTGRE